MFSQSHKIKRLDTFRSIDLDVENHNGVAWEKLNGLLQKKPRLMFAPIKMATLDDKVIEGNLVTYAVYARDKVLYNMLKDFSDRDYCPRRFMWQIRKCSLKFDYLPYYQLAMQRVMLSKKPNKTEQDRELEKQLDKRLEAMQRKMPMHVLWQLSNAKAEWSIDANFTNQVHCMMPAMHIEREYSRPLIKGESLEYDVAVLMRLTQIRDQLFKDAVNNSYKPKITSKL